jgi:hypothetical protein
MCIPKLSFPCGIHEGAEGAAGKTGNNTVLAQMGEDRNDLVIQLRKIKYNRQ